jgi:hypothetical protein
LVVLAKLKLLIVLTEISIRKSKFGALYPLADDACVYVKRFSNRRIFKMITLPLSNKDDYTLVCRVWAIYLVVGTQLYPGMSSFN